jgi:hypothetical protein
MFYALISRHAGTINIPMCIIASGTQLYASDTYLHILNLILLAICLITIVGIPCVWRPQKIYWRSAEFCCIKTCSI